MTAVSIYVVLSRSSTVLSRTIRLATRDEYTHAALALDADLELMFSFGRRRASNPFVGCFKRERLDDDLYRGMDRLPGVVLEVPVTEAQRDAVGARVAEFLLDSHTYAYNAPGLVTGLLGRGSEDDRRFFCSEFVYHVLRDAGVCDLGIPRWKVRPQTLLRVPGKVVYSGDLKRYRSSDLAAAPVPALSLQGADGLFATTRSGVSLAL